MLERWFSVIKLPMSWRQFHRLPQNPAYQYEYRDKAAWLSPRPRFQSARLELRHPGELPAVIDARDSVRFRPLEEPDWPRLSRLFAGAFHQVQPFASLSARRRLEAARGCLKYTREGGDGPLIHPACHVALSQEHPHPVGAVLVTLVPPVNLDDSWSLRWKSPPPPDCIEQRLGHAHLTWIFVGPWHAGYGVGTALLARAALGLIELGYTELISSFLLGNTSSMLWHWRNGFQLLPSVDSRRRFLAMVRASHPLESPSR